MRMITRKRPAFKDLYQTEVLTKIVAVRVTSGKWSLFGVWRDRDIAVFVEAARGGPREWANLEYLSDFCNNLGISIFEVHQRQNERKEIV